MFFRFLVLITLLLTYNFSYSYNFSDSTFKKYNGEYSFSDRYTIPNVKFIAQAPLQTKENWFINYESCEEAALLMSHFTINDMYYDKNVANEEINKLNYYQEFVLGTERNKIHNPQSKQLYIRDITIQEIHTLAKLYYGYTDENSHILNNPSIETIKHLVSNDYILIVPSYTKTLANPNFNLLTNSYHVINIIGYDENNFVTHDPGTSKGESYLYPFQNVLTGIKENGNDVLILEGNKNKGRIDFNLINEKILLEQRANLVVGKINKFIEKKGTKPEDGIKKVLENIRKSNLSKYDNNNSRLLLAVEVKLTERLEIIADRRKNLTYLSDKLREHFDK
ncbi:MAG: C39 family peptidase [Candidatus Gracilibacteria bacterium]|nr:C39 family peptidase [Candidatus Gracilibacteria bacterium]